MSKSKNKPVSSTAKETVKPKQRLIETADRLFYQEGIRAVGIDRIIAEAGVAKMTLYTHFPSKDDLILAVLEYRESSVNHFFQTHIAKYNKKIPLEAFFAAFKDWLESADFRGCAFINATIELADASHAGTVYCRNQKIRFKTMLKGFVEAALGKKDRALVDAISLLVEGAIVTAQVEGKSDSAETAREASLQLIKMQSKQ